MHTRAAADLTTLAAAYVDELRSRRYSSSSIDKAQLELRRLSQHLREEGLTDARAVTEAHLATYARLLAERPTRAGQRLSPASRAAALSVIRRFYAWLEARAIVLHNPARILRLPRSTSLPRGVLTIAQARRLMAAPYPYSSIGQRDRAILELLYGAGLRLGEAARADVTDLDLRSGLLLLRNGKGRKDRIVPISGAAASALSLYVTDSRPELATNIDAALFLSRDGARLGMAGLRARIKYYGRRLGLQLTPHALRTPVPRIYSAAAPTCGTSRRCSAIAGSRPPRSTRASRSPISATCLRAATHGCTLVVVLPDSRIDRARSTHQHDHSHPVAASLDAGTPRMCSH